MGTIGAMGAASAEPDVLERIDAEVVPEDEVAADRPWVTLVWNDPVNLMPYVTHVFQKLFGYSRAKATALMLDVHERGRAAVSSGSREQMERDVTRLHAAGLWATLTHDS